jgi:predicted alpha/beta-fold hydrolase
MRVFEPHPWLKNPHAMTIGGSFWPRHARRLPAGQDRRFEVEPGTYLLAKCHWQAQPREHATLVLVHGLEGSSESGYMRGLAEQAFAAGLNVLRVNQRTCGGSEAMAATLYGSGLSGDYRAILLELVAQDRLPEIFFAGYSMGGNLVLSMAGKWGKDAPAELRGVCGVCPTIELEACVAAIERRENALYQWHFVSGLKARLRRAAQRDPGKFSLEGLAPIRTVREFDDAVTAPHFGYRDADDYYFRASAARVIGNIAVPTLIITAQDDPVVPFAIFGGPEVRGNQHIQVVAPERGGHCAFISRFSGRERFWAEGRVVEFCTANTGSEVGPHLRQE